MKNFFQYDWFETEKELREFVDNSAAEVVGAIEVLVTKEINI